MAKTRRLGRLLRKVIERRALSKETNSDDPPPRTILLSTEKRNPLMFKIPDEPVERYDSYAELSLILLSQFPPLALFLGATVILLNA